MTLDVLEEIFGGLSPDTVGDATVDQEQLPGGEAMRVRRMRGEQGDPVGQGTIIERLYDRILVIDQWPSRLRRGPGRASRSVGAERVLVRPGRVSA